MTALALLITTGVCNAQDLMKVPPAEDQYIRLPSIDKPTAAGATLIAIGASVGGYMLANFEGEKQDAAYLFMGFGCALGTGLIVGSHVKQRQRLSTHSAALL